MHILLVSSSPRKEKSQTFLLAKEAVKGFSGSVTTGILHLSDLKIGFCRHCESCHKRIMDCPVHDDVRMILEKMLEAEGLIFASPNYIDQVTASMKALWERAGHFIHCRRFLGKYVAGVVTSGGGQDTAVLDYIRYYANICAAQYAGGISSRAPINGQKAKEAFNLGNKLLSDIREKKDFPEQIKAIEEFKGHFKNIIQTRKDDWVEEYQYWLKKGWLK